ncbi:MAG TPA: 2-oxo acid dehydrogenase subunit E2 [Xanthobacteraceae bacterium]|nr:2-oxo acid dehydrogenase subunit E2 [Xanthobacteraceae bacterium]
MPEPWVLRAPRLNANDDSVTLTRWLAADRSAVSAGERLAEIETEKATTELAAETGGFLRHAVPAGTAVPIGAPLAYIGAAPETIANVSHGPASPVASPTTPAPMATAKARALAAAHRLDLAAIVASGATIKERDVAHHLSEHRAEAPGPRLVLVGDASPRQRRIARDLRAAWQGGIFTTLAYRLDLRGPERMIAAELAHGRAASLLGILLWGLGRTLPAFSQLVSVLAREKIYRYRDVDIAFAARSQTGDLHAPVVRHVDRLSIDEIGRECARLAKGAMRGKLDAGDVGGASFTVSVIATPRVESFVALPPPAQTAILALGATRHDTAGGETIARPFATATVTYDHALCDGVYVADFCAALDRTLNPEQA